MKRFFLFFLLTIYSFYLFSQGSSHSKALISNKPPIDMDVLNHWYGVSGSENPVISSDGNYVAYKIVEQWAGTHNTLVIQGNNCDWKKEFTGVSGGFFSDDNKLFIFYSADTIFFLTPGTDKLEKLGNIESFQSPSVAKGRWLSYRLNNHPDTLIIHDLVSGIEKRFNDVGRYSFDRLGNTLLVQSRTSNSVSWVSLPEGNVRTILPANGPRVNSYSFDLTGQQIAFLVQTSEGQQTGNSIWYYQSGMELAKPWATDQSAGIDSGLIISNYPPQFSRNGRYVFFKLEPVPDNRKPQTDAASVDIWHYKDAFLQCTQLLNPVDARGSLQQYTATISLQESRVIRLEQAGEWVLTPFDEVNTDFIVVKDKQRDVPWWEQEQGQTAYLVSMKDGARKSLMKGELRATASFSPMGKYLVYFDCKQKHYVSYDLHTGISRNITKLIPEQLTDEYQLTIPGRRYSAEIGIAGWLGNDDALLIYDNYDLWQVDPAGIRPPVNITNGYGRREHIKFRLVYPPKESVDRGGIIKNTALLLTAFNTVNKYNGFYRVHLNSAKKDPEMLIMGPFLLYCANTQIPNSEDAFDLGMRPLKAIGADLWLIKKQTAIDAPNYFLTSDFKNLRPITDVHPQQNHNWITTELVTWRQLDGTYSQGILYKPENFDPGKKYPLIFNYYESLSFRMYEYPIPYYTTYRINIPWFVSRGYLVFTPDIHYSIANLSGKVAGDAAVNAMVSAAKYLAKRPYIDSTRMGIQGHSFSGGETLYIITHSKLFAAACAGAPTVSDEISAYLGLLSPNGQPIREFRLSHAEIGHDFIGATLWERPDLYIKASPVFKANQVTTPLLIMHNHGDRAVDWNQGVEMYMALRRLEKRVWMLQYDGESHSLFKNENAKDYTIRLTQFFDYYLKGALPPKWMTEGIPARQKGIETGLEMDTTGKKP